MADEAKPEANPIFDGEAERTDLVSPEKAEKKIPPKDPETGRFLPTKPQEPETPASPKHPDYLLSQALEFGLGDDEVQEMSTGLLSRTLYRLQRERHQAQVAETRARTLLENAPRQLIPPTDQPVEEGPPVEEGYLDDRLRKWVDATHKQNKDLKARLDRMEQADQLRQHTSATELLDDAFEALGEDYATLFGTKPAQELGNDSAELARRIAVLNKAGVNLANATKASAKKIKAAADILFPRPKKDEPKDPDADSPYNAAKGPKKGNGRISKEEWEEASLAAPTQRKGAPEPKGEELAKKNLKAKMDRLDREAGDGEILEGLLP